MWGGVERRKDGWRGVSLGSFRCFSQMRSGSEERSGQRKERKR